MAALADENPELYGLTQEFGDMGGNHTLGLNADVYRQLALKGLETAPRTDEYIREDSATGGLRGRFGNWAFSFSPTSYSHTLAGVMMNGAYMHSAMPYILIDPVQRTQWQNNNYWITGYSVEQQEFPHSAVIINSSNRFNRTWALSAAAYKPYPQRTTWRGDGHHPGPWNCTQIWFYLPDETIGIMISSAEKDTEARAHEHRFRFSDKGQIQEQNVFRTNGIVLTVLDNNFNYIIPESAKIDELRDNRPGWQLSLSDARSVIEHPAAPGDEVLTQAGDSESLIDGLMEPETEDAGDAELQPTKYEKNSFRYSVISLRPDDNGRVSDVEVDLDMEVGTIEAKVESGDGEYVIVANLSDESVVWEDPPEGIVRTWSASAGEAVSAPKAEFMNELPPRTVCVYEK